MIYINYLCQKRSVFKLAIPKDTMPLPGLGDNVLLDGVEYQVLFRRWHHVTKEPFDIAIDIEVQRQL